MGIQEIYQKEYSMLRQELHTLKNCQVTFLTFSVTATGLLLGLIFRSESINSYGMLALSPLVILLPSWWIFFDKATTITRIVGYIRVLESLILTTHGAVNFIGWENGLHEFRKKQFEAIPDVERKFRTDEAGLPSKWDRLKMTYRYWTLVYLTFFGLIGVCLLISLWFSQGHIILLALNGIPIALFGLSSWKIGRIVARLIWGRNSFRYNQFLWVDILEVYEI